MGNDCFKEEKTISKKKLNYLILLTVLLTSFLCIGVWTLGVYFISNSVSQTVLENEELKKYVQVLNLYDKYSINEVDLKRAIDMSIQSIVLTSNDKYGMYLPSDTKTTVNDRITVGSYRGIGITYEYLENNTLLIKSVIEESPARVAGLKVNDIITHIDGLVVSKDIVIDFMQNINNGSLEYVRLRIDNKDIEVAIGLIEEKKLDYEVIGNIGIIKIYTFVPDTLELFKEAIDYFKTLDLDKVVFDVRDNGGGNLDAVVGMLDYITDEQQLIRLETTTDVEALKDIKGVKGNIIYSDIKNELSKDVDVVVLVNSKSASASEFFTMTLQDTRDALVVGEQTYGKSTVLSYFTFKDGSILAMSTGIYYPISGRLIEGIGIPPDIFLSDEHLSLSAIELSELGLLN